MFRMRCCALLFALFAAGQTQAVGAAANAILSRVPGSPENTFDVTAHGAVGDGVADDTPVGLAIGGFDIDFNNNHVEGGNLTHATGLGSLIADYLGPDSYASYIAKIRIANNTVSGQANGNACLGLFAPDTAVTGNTITVKGSGAGIHAEGPLPQSLTIQNNTLSMGTGNGMMIATPIRDGFTITGNTISGSASAIGIFVASPRSPNSGAHTISKNTIRGFARRISIDLAKHPGTVVSSN